MLSRRLQNVCLHSLCKLECHEKQFKAMRSSRRAELAFPKVSRFTSTALPDCLSTLKHPSVFRHAKRSKNDGYHCRTKETNTAYLQCNSASTQALKLHATLFVLEISSLPVVLYTSPTPSRTI